MDTKEIRNRLDKVGYCSNSDIDCSLAVTMLTGKPLLIEGAPGVGKTSLAKAVADAYGMPFIRVQMYDGLTDDKLIYDYDYQKQLLTLEAVKPVLEREFKDRDVNEIIHQVAGKLDFYGRDFMIERPLLRAVNGNGKKVLLIDEIDKAPEEIEYMLYEFMENYSITIPQYGTVACPEGQEPLVFVTSNCYRDLSDAFKRRCNYLYLEQKTKEEMVEILRAKAGASEKVAEGIAVCLLEANEAGFYHAPSISEGIELAKYLGANPECTKDFVIGSLGLIVKDRKDFPAMKEIMERKGSSIWE